MTTIGIVIGSTRPGRLGESVARWVHEVASKRDDANFEIVDIANYELPLLDEKAIPAAGQYEQPHTLVWSQKIQALDGFVFITPEYNHGAPAALKNAIDFLYGEWANKAAGFVSYGVSGGVRSVEQLRQVFGQLQLADVRSHVELSLFTDFIDMATFSPDERHEATLNALLDEVAAWSGALASLRVAA